MANTLATEKQAAAIKHRMAEIRTELPYHADIARHSVSQLTDWKYHLSRHPLPILAVTVAAGYLLVPASREPERVVDSRSGETISRPAKKGFVSGFAGAIATMALKQATSLAISHANQFFVRQGDRA